MSNLSSNLRKHTYRSLMIALIFLSTSIRAQEVKWSFDGDSAKLDLPNKTTRYFGNTRFENEHYIITGDMLEVKQTGEQNKRSVQVEGKPAKVATQSKQQNSFSLSAKNIGYLESQSLLKSNGDVNMKLNNSQGEVRLKGNDLQITQATQGVISINGSPAIMDILQKDGKNISAQANTIVFDQKASLFTMHDKVVLKTDRETITAAKIFYNLADKTLEIPKVPNERVEMVQKVKKQ